MSGRFRRWDGSGVDSWLVSNCLLTARKMLLDKGITSEGLGFVLGLADLGQSFFLGAEFKTTMFAFSLGLITE